MHAEKKTEKIKSVGVSASNGSKKKQHINDCLMPKTEIKQRKPGILPLLTMHQNGLL